MRDFPEHSANFLISKANAAFGYLLFEVTVWVQLARLVDPTHYLCQYQRTRRPNAAAGPAWTYSGSYNFSYIDDSRYIKCLELGIKNAVDKFASKQFDDNQIDKTSIAFKLGSNSKFALMSDMEEQFLDDDSKHELNVFCTKLGIRTANMLSRKDTGYSRAMKKCYRDIPYAGNSCLKLVTDGSNFKFEHVKIDEIAVDTGVWDVKWTYRKTFVTKYELQDIVSPEEFDMLLKKSPILSADILYRAYYTLWEISFYNEETDCTYYWIILHGGGLMETIRKVKLNYKLYHYARYNEQEDRYYGVPLLEPYYEKLRKIQEQAFLAEELMLRAINPPQWQSSIFFKHRLDLSHGAQNEVDVSMIQDDLPVLGGFDGSKAFGVIDTKVKESMDAFYTQRQFLLKQVEEALFMDIIDVEEAMAGKPGNPKTATEIAELVARSRSRIKDITEPTDRQQESLLNAIVSYLLDQVRTLFKGNPELKIFRNPEEYKDITIKKLFRNLPKEVKEVFHKHKIAIESMKREYDAEEDLEKKFGKELDIRESLEYMVQAQETMNRKFSEKAEEIFMKEISYIKKYDTLLYFGLTIPQVIIDLMEGEYESEGACNILRPEFKGQSYKFGKQRELSDMNNTIMAIANIAQLHQNTAINKSINIPEAIHKIGDTFNTFDILKGKEEFREMLEANEQARAEAQNQQLQQNNQDIEGKAIENMNNAQGL